MHAIRKMPLRHGITHSHCPILWTASDEQIRHATNALGPRWFGGARPSIPVISPAAAGGFEARATRDIYLGSSICVNSGDKPQLKSESISQRGTIQVEQLPYCSGRKRLT